MAPYRQFVIVLLALATVATGSGAFTSDMVTRQTQVDTANTTESAYVGINTKPVEDGQNRTGVLVTNNANQKLQIEAERTDTLTHPGVSLNRTGGDAHPGKTVRVTFDVDCDLSPPDEVEVGIEATSTDGSTLGSGPRFSVETTEAITVDCPATGLTGTATPTTSPTGTATPSSTATPSATPTGTQ
jgi:hypothetical protein